MQLPAQGPPPPDDAPGTALFPACGQLANLVRAEILGLSDDRLDWTSDRWEWSRWSIRQHVSHVASLIYTWLLGHWGPRLFPEGIGLTGPDYQTLLSVEYGPHLDERLFHEMEDIEQALRTAVALAVQVLRRETVASLRERTLALELGPRWELFRQAHPTGVHRLDEPDRWEITLEATFRHLHFEFIAHLFNIQRIKRAQGEIAVCDLPREGYIILPEWDRSEPEAPPAP